MHLTLKVVQKDNANFSTLLKQMCQLQCRIRVDMKQGEINIFNMDDNSVEGLIDAVSEVFDFEAINLVPTSVPSTEAVPAATSSSVVSSAAASNSVIETRLNDLTTQVRQIVKHSKVPSRVFCQHIETTMSELKMRFESHEKLSFKVGDIVSCNYGTHLLQEISGTNVHALVCSIAHGMAFVIPITKKNKQRDDRRYIPVKAGEQINYLSSDYTGGTLLINRGNYVNPSRFTEVVGSANTDFLEEVFKLLPAVTTFSAANIRREAMDDTSDLPFDLEMPDTSLESSCDDVAEEQCENAETPESEIAPVEQAEGSESEVAPVEQEEYVEGTGLLDNPDQASELDVVAGEQVETSENDVEAVEQATPNNEAPVSDNSSTHESKKVTVERFMSELLEPTLELLGTSKTLDENADVFLRVSGLFEAEDIVTDSYSIMKYALLSASKLKDITLTTVYLKLTESYLPALSEKDFKTSLANTLKKWVYYPTVCENYSRVSPIPLLKVFSTKMKYLNLL